MKRKKVDKSFKIVTLIISICVVISIVFFGTDITINDIIGVYPLEYILSNNDNETYDSLSKLPDDILEVHFVDVGQGDAIIITKDDEACIIDAGPNSSEEKLCDYIEEIGIDSFKYVFATHAHEDHIGGMDKVISNFGAHKVIFPKTMSTTKTYERFIDSVIAKNLKLNVPKVGDKYILDEDVILEILAPNSDEYEEQNNYSIVLKLTYNNVSYLFTGDAEILSENEMLENNLDVKADVLKLGHHGSSTSSSAKFLDKVSPKYAIISLAKDNDYNHPHSSVINRLSIRNIKVYRTDICGTIISKTDGNVLEFEFEKGE